MTVTCCSHMTVFMRNTESVVASLQCDVDDVTNRLHDKEYVHWLRTGQTDKHVWSLWRLCMWCETHPGQCWMLQYKYNFKRFSVCQEVLSNCEQDTTLIRRQTTKSNHCILTLSFSQWARLVHAQFPSRAPWVWDHRYQRTINTRCRLMPTPCVWMH